MTIRPARPRFPRRHAQRGLFLIEALIAILVVALGILGMIAMGGAAVSAQSDAQYRTEAQSNAEAIAAAISLRADRSGDAALLAASLPPFRHNATTTGDCNFTGDDAADPEVLALMQRISNQLGSGMVGADVMHQQVLIETDDTTNHNRVTITLCWRAPSDSALRQHVYITHVNGTRDS